MSQFPGSAVTVQGRGKGPHYSRLRKLHALERRSGVVRRQGLPPRPQVQVASPFTALLLCRGFRRLFPIVLIVPQASADVNGTLHPEPHFQAISPSFRLPLRPP